MIARALTIAGSDSGGGAGIQQDLKTFHSLGVWGLSAVTAVTAQDTTRVHAVHAVPTDIVVAQIQAVLSDIGADAIKTGMLSSAQTAGAVADTLRSAQVRCLVVDPVLTSSTGQTLTPSEALHVFRTMLLPMATITTPNAVEAALLAGMEAVRSRSDQGEAARRIHGVTGCAALVTGGHIEGDATDVFFDGTDLIEFSGDRIESRGAHGTGCMLSAALTAALAKGETLRDAVSTAKRFVTQGIRSAPSIGKGTGPVTPPIA